MADEQVFSRSDTSDVPVRIGPITRVQVVIQSVRPFDFIQVRQIEALLLKFLSTVVLKLNRLPYQNIVIRPPTVTADSVIRLELREHLRIKSDAGRLDLLTGVAHGLRYIHDLDIVHRRLEFGTVEVDRNGEVRISDFQQSSVPPSKLARSTMGVHPSFIGSAPDPGLSRTWEMKIYRAHDMYAFGLLSWELFTSKTPPRSDSTPAWLSQPDHPELSDEVWVMIKKCLETDPSRRLTVAEAEAILEAEPVYVNWGFPLILAP